VTKIGIWLMPRPQQIAACMITLADDDALADLVDTLRPLLLEGTIQSNVVIGNAPVIASMVSERATWHQGAGVLGDAAVEAIKKSLGLGSWNARFGLYGRPGLLAARQAAVEEAIASIPGAAMSVRTYDGDVDPEQVHPADRAQLGVPSTDLIRMAAWRGGEPAHTDFSLVCPPTGTDAVRQVQFIRARVEEYGFDYAGGFTLNPRHAIALALVSFDKNDPGEAEAVRNLFPALIRDAAAHGYAPYRSHVAFMDLIAEQYDFGDAALRRLTQTLKAAVDPSGVLSPGKQGIWPLTS
jgi:4-cresol dehydrogenase (hydroxylating)